MASLLGWAKRTLFGDFEEQRRAEENAARARERALNTPAKYGVLSTAAGKRQFAQSSQLPNSRSIGSQVWDQVNPLDNNRSVSNPNALNQESILRQSLNQANNFKEQAMSPYRYDAEAISKMLDYATGNKMDEATRKLNETNAEYTRVLNDLQNAPYKPRNLDSAIKENAIKLSDTSKRINKESIATEKATNPRRFAANTASIALDALTLGSGATATMGPKQALRAASKQSFIEGGLAGTTGALGNENIDPKTVAMSTALGAGIGGAIPYIGYGAKKVITPRAVVNEAGAVGKNVNLPIIDKKLQELQQARKSAIDYTANEIKQASNMGRNVKGEVLKAGGISSSAYERLPKGVRRKSGASADKVAQTLGYDSEDALIEALNSQTKPLTSREARRIAEEQLASGKHPYSKDFESITDELKNYQDELSVRYPKGTRNPVKTSNKAPEPASEARLLALQNTPEGQTVRRATKYATVQSPKLRIKELDAEAQRLVKQGATKDEVANLYMKRTGMVYGEALKEADRLGKWSNPSITREVKQGIPVDIVKRKDIRLKRTLSGVASARNVANAEANLVTAKIQTAAKKLGINTSDSGLINRYQTGRLLPGKEQEFGKIVKTETDRLFNLEKQLDSGIEYRQNYLPQKYAENSQQVQNAIQIMQTNTGAGKSRYFRTFDEANQAPYNLTPQYKNIEQMVGAEAKKAKGALANRQVVDDAIQQGLFSTAPQDRSWRLVEGFSASNGSPVYASPKAAGIINNAVQQGTSALQKTVHGLGKFNATWQDIMLAGGVPYTPANFYVLGQVAKELTAGRVTVAKDFALSFSDNLTQKRWVQKADFVRDMTERGVPLNIKTKLSDTHYNWLQNKWGNAVNRPTFERFLPNQYLSVAENIYKSARKNISDDAAKDLAANTVKKYYGIVDQIAKGRSTETQNLINATLFAPRYRETILNTLFNTGRSILDPTTWGDKSYHMNRRLAAGMAITFAGMEMLQYQLTGKSTFDNREGQELALEIPYGPKDKNGNQKVVNIPFMPGFMTVPRAGWDAVNGILNKDSTAVAKAGSKMVATPGQVAGQVLTNSDYFGRPIYRGGKRAEEEGVTPDSTVNQAKDIGKYVALSGAPGWVRAGVGKAQGKSNLETVAVAGELPLRFGTHMNPSTTAYFDTTKEFKKKLNPNEQVKFTQINPAKKNAYGDLISKENPGARIEKSTILKNDMGFFKKYSSYQRELRDKTGQKIDPVYELDAKRAKAVLVARSLNPGESSDEKQKQLYNKKWYESFKNKEDSYYKSLEKKFGKYKDPYGYPKESAKITKLQKDYYNLPENDGPMGGNLSRRLYIESHPELTNYWDKRRVAQNKHRKALGLTPLEDPTKDFVKYNKKGSSNSKSYSKKSGGKGSRGGASIGSIPKTASYATIPAPKKITVKKLANPFPARKTKKLSVNKIPTNYLSKRLG